MLTFVILAFIIICVALGMMGYEEIGGMRYPRKRYDASNWDAAPCRFIQYLYDDPAHTRKMRPVVHRSILNCMGKHTEKLLYKYPICACYLSDSDGHLNRVGWHKKGECPHD